MRIAFSDIKHFAEWGNKNNKNYVDFKDSNMVDGEIVQEVKKGKDGISVKLQDKQKALDWLAEYFIEHPDDKYKKEYDNAIIGLKNKDFELKEKEFEHRKEMDKKRLELEEKKYTTDSTGEDNKRAIKEFIEATKADEEELDELFEEELNGNKTEEK